MFDDLLIILVYAGYFSAFMLVACILGLILDRIPNSHRFIDWIFGEISYSEIFEEEEEN